MTALLRISDLHVSYGALPAVRGVRLELPEGNLRVILGANGAGKTTIIKAVLDNLKMGAFAQRDAAETARRIEEMFDRFPRLRERQGQLAGSLSGGEQQMVAIARALVARPRLILMDEPSLGLAPIVVRDVFRLVTEINRAGITVLMVEQNAACRCAASWAYLLDVGRIVIDGAARELEASREVQDVFLGGRG